MENNTGNSYEENNSQPGFENLADTVKDEIETNVNPDPSLVDNNEQTTKKDNEDVKDFNEFKDNFNNDKKRSNSKRSSGSKEYKDAIFSVSNPITKEGMRNFTMYTVECNLIKNIVYKRFSDFDSLRSKLLERWPGIYIPNIPKKKMTGNLDTALIEMRCKQLDSFVKKIIQMPYLLNSPEVRLFLNSEEVDKTLSKLPKETFDEILIKYKTTFLNIIKDPLQDNKNTAADIEKCNNFMNKILVNTLTTLRVRLIIF
jgi:hypothetical protein